jgi:hypothetical protein
MQGARKLRRSRFAGAVGALVFALGSSAAYSQAAPSAYRGSDTLWVGLDAAYVNASFPYQSGQHIEGLGVFGDFNMNVRFSIEGSAHFLKFGGFESATETSYLIGPRYRFNHYGRWQPYAQGLAGLGGIHYPFAIGDAHYFAIAPGAGVRYRMSSRWEARGEYEYQIWLNSPGYSNQPNHPLRPSGVHLGMAYHPFR